MKKALISGITGQDGSYLAEFLLNKGYEVHGIIRRSSSFNTGRLNEIYQDPHVDDRKLFLHYGDLVDSLSIDDIVKNVKPNEVYNLGAQSHVKVSFEIPKYTGEVDAMGTLHMLEAIRKHCPKAKFYNATTSELYGKIQETPQTETTPFYPRSPYGVAKLYSYWIVKNYRESYGIFACNGILFNHESPRRGGTFVTKKVISKLVQISKSKEHTEPLYVGNLEAKRDWGYAPEFVEGMWKMLQQENPDDFVLATGEAHSVKELIEETCKLLEIPLEWRGRGCRIEDNYQWEQNSFKPYDKKYHDWIGVNPKTDEILVKVDPKYFRPSEVNLLIGDYSKAKEILGWKPKTKFHDLIKIMIEHEKHDTNSNNRE